ncbi:FlgN protein [Clostridium tepidiprofundi DSM 19306]|uniref:FlgN protein n=1 Tax=Clostridium tepidiprofundi DSM 19306 TaxID=1121338 RepID=A0A151B4G4_9CLOT|nr:flagellar protein FlgN [Clostridium tepidiprofundi]KYH34795.1 FlgN protein [Clostridium tepidiprofundi DSM 19306]
MIEELKEILVSEIEAFKSLLSELESQYNCIIKKDVFGMESCVDKIKNANKNIAILEMERRKLCGDKEMGKIIECSDDKELENNYRETRKILYQIKLQNETNEILLKQGLSYTNQMLNILNPSPKVPNTYNSYGKSRR